MFDEFTPEAGQAQPLYQQLRSFIVEGIRQGRLRPGLRLPPTRQLARRTGLARQTVLAAYQELQADGWVAGQVGRGTYVLGRPIRRQLP